jgi:hypothetical protein
MGGHAVRYYGLQRFTNDFDFALAPDSCHNLPDRLSQSGLFPDTGPIEGNSWRPGDFRRFHLRSQSDGHDEWLEFWIRNHLLAPFPELLAREEFGQYGSARVPFLSLQDLIRSKETERAKDWEDISYLEEFQDARLYARCIAGELPLANALARIRSRRGYDAMIAEARFRDEIQIRTALGLTTNPVTQAFLLPWAPNAVALRPVVPIEPLIDQKIRSSVPASSLHYALVEVVRRQYKVFRQDEDRADKQAIIAARHQPP